MYRYYALGMLALVYAVSYMDRQIISILLDDLKAEFLLTDTQLGLYRVSHSLFFTQPWDCLLRAWRIDQTAWVSSRSPQLFGAPLRH